MPVEQKAEAMERIASQSQEVEWLGSGYGGGAAVEGPVWWKEGGYLLFSDIGSNQRLKWGPGDGITVFQEPTNNANGLTRDPQGRLIACEHGARRVTRQEPDGSATVVANNYQGRRLNRPNDVGGKVRREHILQRPGSARPEPGPRLRGRIPSFPGPGDADPAGPRLRHAQWTGLFP